MNLNGRFQIITEKSQLYLNLGISIQLQILYFLANFKQNMRSKIVIRHRKFKISQPKIK